MNEQMIKDGDREKERTTMADEFVFLSFVPCRNQIELS